MAKKLKKITISRKHWSRGNTKGNTALRTESGQSCCLGFVARACVVQTKTGAAEFTDLNPKFYHLLPEKLRPATDSEYDVGNECYMNSSLHDELIEANDSDNLKGRDREKKITELFRQAGLKAVFVD